MKKEFKMDARRLMKSAIETNNLKMARQAYEKDLNCIYCDFGSKYQPANALVYACMVGSDKIVKFILDNAVYNEKEQEELFKKGVECVRSNIELFEKDLEDMPKPIRDTVHSCNKVILDMLLNYNRKPVKKQTYAVTLDYFKKMLYMELSDKVKHVSRIESFQSIFKYAYNFTGKKQTDKNLTEEERKIFDYAKELVRKMTDNPNITIRTILDNERSQNQIIHKNSGMEK